MADRTVSTPTQTVDDDVVRTRLLASALETIGRSGTRDELGRGIVDVGRRLFGSSFVLRWRDDVSPRPRSRVTDDRTMLVDTVRVGGRAVGWLSCAVHPSDVDRGRSELATLTGCLSGAMATNDLSRSNDQFAQFERGFEETTIGMQILSPEDTFVRVNKAFADFVGWSADELVGRSWREVSFDDDIERAAAQRALLWSRAVPSHHEVKRYRRRDGRAVWGSLTLTPTFDRPSDPHPAVVIAQVVDMSDQIEQLESVRRELIQSERRYRSLIAPSPNPVLRVRADGTIVDANSVASDLLGLDGVADRPVRLERAVPTAIAETLMSLIDVTLRDGSPQTIQKMRLSTPITERWFRVTVFGEDGPYVHIALNDITDLVQNEARLSTMALTDALTGVANRAAIHARLQHALDRLERHSGSGVAVAAVDLDHFKSVNDTFGHAFGDPALCRFAQGTSSTLRTQDSIGRLGGDEFLIVLEDVASASLADEIARRISDSVNPLVVEQDGGRAIELSSSVGVAWTGEAMSADELMERADRALLDAKRDGRGRVRSEPTDRGDGPFVSHERVTGSELSSALESGEFELHYQPIVGPDRRIVAVEALLRWRHPTRGLLLPDDFLENLIHSGHMGPVGAWVLDTAMDQLASWDRDGLVDLHLNINVSPAELAHPRFRDVLRQSIDRHSFDEKRVVVELTETALGGSLVAPSTLRDVASIGVRLVLDDFGTGVSSISQLRTESLSGIKVDRSFVSSTSPDDRNRRITEGLIALAHQLGIEVTAEGVETEEQQAWIGATGCERMQGWLFSQAVTADRIPELVAASAPA